MIGERREEERDSKGKGRDGREKRDIQEEVVSKRGGRFGHQYLFNKKVSGCWEESTPGTDARPSENLVANKKLALPPAAFGSLLGNRL